MEVEEFEERVLGDAVDMSIRHKDADEKAVIFTVSEMPFRDTLKRLANEVHPTRGDYPCYMKVEGEDAIDIGFMKLTMDKVTKCLNLLIHANPKLHWVTGGVLGAEIQLEELLATVKYKVGGDIGEYI